MLFRRSDPVVKHSRESHPAWRRFGYPGCRKQAPAEDPSLPPWYRPGMEENPYKAPDFLSPGKPASTASRPWWRVTALEFVIAVVVAASLWLLLEPMVPRPHAAPRRTTLPKISAPP